MTCNYFKHKSKDIYYAASRVILIKNMGHQCKVFDRCQQTSNILHNTVMACLQQLALLVPTLGPTRWQQSVSTARRRRRRRRNTRRVGWAVARRCERQRRGSQHAETVVCRTRHCEIGTRMPCIVAPSPSNNTRITLNAA